MTHEGHLVSNQQAQQANKFLHGILIEIFDRNFLHGIFARDFCRGHFPLAGQTKHTATAPPNNHNAIWAQDQHGPKTQLTPPLTAASALERNFMLAHTFYHMAPTHKTNCPAQHSNSQQANHLPTLTAP